MSLYSPGTHNATSHTFVGCKATHSTTQATTSGTDLVLAWDTETYDTDAIHDTVTNNSRFTVPSGMGGKWNLATRIRYAANASGTRDIGYRLNGGSTVYIAQTPGNAIARDIHASTTLTLAAADYIEVIAWQNSGAGINVGSESWTEFKFCGK